ncbi:MAG: aminomethyltransferase [Gammaproteobacteria bacterium]|jgi:aminomethyltransferase
MTEDLSRTSALAARSQERFIAAGISIDHNDARMGGKILKLDVHEVGRLNSPAYSHRLGKSLALVQLAKSASQAGTRLEVCSDDLNRTATVESTPIFDQTKSRTHV